MGDNPHLRPTRGPLIDAYIASFGSSCDFFCFTRAQFLFKHPFHDTRPPYVLFGDRLDTPLAIYLVLLLRMWDVSWSRPGTVRVQQRWFATALQGGAHRRRLIVAVPHAPYSLDTSARGGCGTWALPLDPAFENERAGRPISFPPPLWSCGILTSDSEEYGVRQGVPMSLTSSPAQAVSADSERAMCTVVRPTMTHPHEKSARSLFRRPAGPSTAAAA